MIWADANERTGHEFETANLDSGDYCVEGPAGKYLIERKDWPDFVDSWRTGHLYSQLRRMNLQDHQPVLVIEGDRRYPHTQINWGEDRRYLTAVVAGFDVPVIPTRDTDETLSVVEDFEDWSGESDDRVHSVRTTKKVKDSERGQYILEGLPNVGPSRAQDLLDEFGTPRQVMTASIERLQDVEGIGPSTAEAINDALTS